MLRFRLLLLSVLFLLLPTTIFANLSITVEEDKRWPGQSTEDIKIMCETLISQFQKQLRYENKIRNMTINIQYGGPQVRYIPWTDTHEVSLSVSGEWWQEQLFYQFGHEFCHILHNHETFGGGHENKWFYESMCLMASIWVMNNMSENWLDISPKHEWNGWGKHIKTYADANENREEAQFEGAAQEWINEFEQFLRDDAKNTFTHHLLAAQLSYQFFLPIFEKNPEAWNAVRQMPTSRGKMSEYMKDWYRNVDIEDKRFVEAIAKEMGIEITPVVAIEINPFAKYVNLTFSHSDDNSIKPINNSREWNGYAPLSIKEKRPNGIVINGTRDLFNEMHELSNWVYSHAPATIVYDISDINYTSFGAYFFLPHPFCGGGASMEFIAKADNVELYSEKFYLPDYGEYIEFEIPSDTQILNLTIGDLGNQGCDHFVLGEPRLYQSNIFASKETTDMIADVNKDGYVDLSDVRIVRSAIQNRVSYDTDVNDDGKTDEIDVLIVKQKAMEAIVAAAPSLQRRKKAVIWGALKQRR